MWFYMWRVTCDCDYQLKGDVLAYDIAVVHKKEQTFSQVRTIPFAQELVKLLIKLTPARDKRAAQAAAAASKQ